MSVETRRKEGERSDVEEKENEDECKDDIEERKR